MTLHQTVARAASTGCRTPPPRLRPQLRQPRPCQDALLACGSAGLRHFRPLRHHHQPSIGNHLSLAIILCNSTSQGVVLRRRHIQWSSSCHPYPNDHTSPPRNGNNILWT
jgi:hypothetical protein